MSLALFKALAVLSVDPGCLGDRLTSRAEIASTMPHYILYIEPDLSKDDQDKLQKRLSPIFDIALREVHAPYDRQRSNCRIGEAQVKILIPGAFLALKSLLVSIGKSSASKVPSVIKSQRQINLLEVYIQMYPIKN